MDRTINDYCPYLKRETSIRIHYSYIPILNSTKENYKAFDFKCEHFESCPLNNKCPIYYNNITIEV